MKENVKALFGEREREREKKVRSVMQDKPF